VPASRGRSPFARLGPRPRTRYRSQALCAARLTRRPVQGSYFGDPQAAPIRAFPLGAPRPMWRRGSGQSRLEFRPLEDSRTPFGARMSRLETWMRCGSRYLARSAWTRGFSAGTSTVAVCQTVERSMPNHSWAAMLRMPFILRHGICGAIAWTSYGMFVTASPMTTRAKQTASTVFSSRAKSASWTLAV